MRPLKLAAVLVCAAAQAWAVQAHAAVVIQTRAFSHLQQVLATYDEDSDLFSDQLAQASGSGATAVGFDAFDPDLGTLTDVRLVLSSVQRFHYGASVLGQGLIGLFDGRGLGHPLLVPDVRIDNEVQLPGPGSALIVTGSNMAGKSTLLRALGLNTALALAGGPVCAAGFKLPVVRLRASMRIDDSLQRGASYFHAELQKLQQRFR